MPSGSVLLTLGDLLESKTFYDVSVRGKKKGLFPEKLPISLKLFNSVPLTTQILWMLKGCIIPLSSSLCESLKNIICFQHLVLTYIN